LAAGSLFPEARKRAKLSFHLDFEFTNKLIEMAFGRIFKELAMNMVQAFTTRAKEVYSVG
jgi:ribosome-associated toxin RatA of RatAB toxin-antitoxin module